MLVTLEEMKQYLRVDFSDDDELIATLIASAERLCTDILREDDAAALCAVENAKTAVMYAAAYFYEHRDDADYHALALLLRSLLFAYRKEIF